MSQVKMKSTITQLVSVLVIITLTHITYATCTRSNTADKIETDLPITRKSVALNTIGARGYFGEMYAFKASDGATLTAFHVINPLAERRTLYKNPVIIFHGIAGDSAQMLQTKSDAIRPQKPVIGKISVNESDADNLALFLANSNFDVWLLDSLGTDKVMRKLGNHNVDPIGFNQAYWNFSLDEQSLHHFPSQIDFVLAQTSAKKVHAITYSSSAFFGLALLSRRSEYNNKLASFVALGPVAFLEHISGLSAPLILPDYIIPDFIANTNTNPPYYAKTFGASLKLICTVFKRFCRTIISLFLGGGDFRDSVAYIQQDVKGTSLKAFKHFAQLWLQHRFGMYDYGLKKNLIKYGTKTPPDYDLGKVRFPRIITVRGGSDLVSTVPDQLKLIRNLGTKTYMDIFLPNYNHISYVTASTVAKDLNIPLANALLQITLQPDELLFSTPEIATVPGKTEGVPMVKQRPIARVSPNHLPE